MAGLRKNIWMSDPSKGITLEQVQDLADHFNTKLTPMHQVDVVEISSGWYLISGSPQAQAVCDKEMKHLNEVKKNKEQVSKGTITHGNPFTSQDVREGRVIGPKLS